MTTEKIVVLAEPNGFCAGVRRAIAMAERALEIHGAPVYVRKEIAHNHYVTRAPEKRGAILVESEDEVPVGAVCVLSAHGAAPAVREHSARRELRTIDATCPPRHTRHFTHRLCQSLPKGGTRRFLPAPNGRVSTPQY